MYILFKLRHITSNKYIRVFLCVRIRFVKIDIIVVTYPSITWIFTVTAHISQFLKFCPLLIYSVYIYTKNKFKSAIMQYVHMYIYCLQN